MLGMLGGRLRAAVFGVLAVLQPAFGSTVIRVDCRDGEQGIHSREVLERPLPLVANILCDADETGNGRCVFQATVAGLHPSAGVLNTKPLRVRAGRSRIIRVQDHAESVTSVGSDPVEMNIRLRVRCRAADR